MSCEIKIGDNNKVTVTRYPSLWKEIQENVEGFTQQLGIYAEAVSEGFLKYEIKNPTLLQVLGYIDIQATQDNIKPLTKKEKEFILDFSINRGDAKSTILGAFTTKEGVFGYDEDVMIQYFPEHEVETLFRQQPKEIESIYYKLKNGYEVSGVSQVYPLVKRNADQTIENPDYTIEFLEQNYAGLKTPMEIENRATIIEHDITDAEVDYILENLSDMDAVVEYTPNGEIKRYNKTSDILKQTFKVGQESSALLTTLNTLQSVTADTWIEDEGAVEDVLIELEERAEALGLDVSGVTERYNQRIVSQRDQLDNAELARELQEFSNYLDLLTNFVEGSQNMEITEAQVDTFAEAHDAFFGDLSFSRRRMIPESRYKQFAMSGRVSEEFMMEEHSSIKAGVGVYQKVPKLSLTQVREEIYNRMKPGNEITTLEKTEYNKEAIMRKIDKFLEDRARQIATPNSNYETLKVIQGTKYIYGFQDVYEDVSMPDGVVNPSDIETEVYKEMLDNSELFEVIGISHQGIELLTGGEYTRRYLENNLKSFKKLQDYAVVTGIESLKPLVPVNTKMNAREYYVNNPHKLEQFTSEYKKPTPTTVLTMRDTQEFINIENEIYEKVGPMNYERVAPYSTEIQTELRKPEQVIENPKEYFPSVVEKVTTKTKNIENLMC